MRLAFIGSMNDEIIVQEDLACDLIRVICRYYPEALTGRYGLEECPRTQQNELTQEDAAKVLADIAESRKCIARGGGPDLSRAAALFIDDFRSGRLGRLTLEQRGGNCDEEKKDT